MAWVLIIVGAILIFYAGCKGFWCLLGIILIFSGLALDIYEDKSRQDWNSDAMACR